MSLSSDTHINIRWINFYEEKHLIHKLERVINQSKVYFLKENILTY